MKWEVAPWMNVSWAHSAILMRQVRNTVQHATCLFHGWEVIPQGTRKLGIRHMFSFFKLEYIGVFKSFASVHWSGGLQHQLLLGRSIPCAGTKHTKTKDQLAQWSQWRHQFGDLVKSLSCPAPVKIRLNWQRLSEVDKSTDLILLRTISTFFNSEFLQHYLPGTYLFRWFLFHLWPLWRWVSSFAPLRRTQFNLSLKQSSWYQIG